MTGEDLPKRSSNVNCLFHSPSSSVFIVGPLRSKSLSSRYCIGSRSVPMSAMTKLQWRFGLDAASMNEKLMSRREKSALLHVAVMRYCITGDVVFAGNVKNVFTLESGAVYEAA